MVFYYRWADKLTFRKALPYAPLPTAYYSCFGIHGLLQISLEEVEHLLRIELVAMSSRVVMHYVNFRLCMKAVKKCF